MNSETLKQLGEPSNDMEREIFEYLTACSDPELDTRILEKKLSLEGCLEFCLKKARLMRSRSRITVYPRYQRSSIGNGFVDISESKKKACQQESRCRSLCR